MKSANQILIHREDYGFSAEFLGPDAQRIYDQFGTSILPTRYTHETRAQTVVKNIQKLNPNTEVYLCGCAIDVQDYSGQPVQLTGCKHFWQD